MLKDKWPDIWQKICKILRTAAVTLAIVTAIGVIYAFAVHRQFTLRYAFMANFIVAGVLMATGLLLPATPKSMVKKLRNQSQLADSTMHRDYMETRSEMQKKGHQILWIGLTVGLVAGLVEVMLWLL